MNRDGSRSAHHNLLELKQKRFGATGAISGPRVLVSLLALVALFFALGASPAFAAKGAVKFFGGAGHLGGQFASLEGMDINQNGTGGAAEGDLYVVDSYGARIQQFSSSGDFIRAFGLDVGGSGVNVCTEAASCGYGTASAAAGGLNPSGGAGITIEQATGNVYVSETGSRRVDVFSATGVFQGAFGWNVKLAGGAEELQFCTAVTGCKVGGGGTGAGQIINPGTGANAAVGAPAISPLNGHLLLADPSNQRIDEFAPTVEAGVVTGISFVRAFGWGAVNGAAEFQVCIATCHAPGPPGLPNAGQFGPEGPSKVAVANTGKVYAGSNWFYTNPSDPLSNDRAATRIETFDPEGNSLGSFADPSIPDVSVISGIAVNPEDDHVFVIDQDGEQQLLEFGPAGNLVEAYFSEREISAFSGGVAVAKAGDVYLAESAHTGVITLGTIVPPTASIDPVSTFTGTTATFSGHVNPEGLFAKYRFEYSSDGGEKWTAVPPTEAELPPDSAEHAVSREAASLEALTKYQVRLVAIKALGAGEAVAEISFETGVAAPIASAPVAVAISDSGAKLEGTVNPENEDSSYRFQCVSQVEFEASGYANAVDLPPGGETVAAAGADVKVSQPASGLTPATTYRCRLLASNATGSVIGPEMTFNTYLPAGVGLPDGRAYEQASPVQKNAADVRALERLSKAAPDGSAITFYSTAGTGGGEGGQQFPSYVATRRGGEWGTYGLLPSSVFGERTIVKGWSDDLTRSYPLLWNSGTNATLYVRENETGAMHEIASDLVPASGEKSPEGAAYFADESAGGAEVLFESNTVLAPEAKAGVSNLYVWDRASGEISLASVLPNGSTAPSGAFAGTYYWLELNAKRGGAAVRNYTQDMETISNDGSRVFFTTSNVNQLYVRKNPTSPGASTVQVSASQKTVPDPKGPKKAAFMEATPDGHYVFFTSPSELTNDATTGTADQGNDLYRYDTESGELIDIAPDEADANGAEVQGVLGSSDDGSYVYFVANGVLAGGAMPGGCALSPITGFSVGTGPCNIYLWHDGTINFVSRMADDGGIGDTDSSNWQPGNREGILPDRSAQVTPDGKTATFTSKLQLTSYDNEGLRELYRYNTSEGLTCVSCSPTGAAPVGPVGLRDIAAPAISVASQTAFILHNLSSSGGRVFFESADKLVASDVNGDAGCPLIGEGVRTCQDVYEWEAKGEGSCQSEAQNGGCLYLISSGESPEPSYFADAGANGADAFFLTRQQLVRQDTDQLLDVYDARVGGGIAAQNAPPPTPCEGEACKQGVPVTPTSESPGSASFTAAGNPKPNHHKKKRHAKKHHKKKAKKQSKARAHR
jgi:hypothetical protein